MRDNIVRFKENSFLITFIIFFRRMNIGFINTLQALIHHAFPRREGIFFSKFWTFRTAPGFFIGFVNHAQTSSDMTSYLLSLSREVRVPII
jgi:hypothetical protein